MKLPSMKVKITESVFIIEQYRNAISVLLCNKKEEFLNDKLSNKYDSFVLIFVVLQCLFRFSLSALVVFVSDKVTHSEDKIMTEHIHHLGRNNNLRFKYEKAELYTKLFKIEVE